MVSHVFQPPARIRCKPSVSRLLGFRMKMQNSELMSFTIAEAYMNDSKG
jgi:hypothetical protein